MRKSKILAFALALGVPAALVTPAASAEERGGHDNRRIITVGFGAGLNTAQPGNPLNHHILPDVIRVEMGDVVNFVVAGFHVIRVYDQGVRLRDVKALIPDECETNPVDTVALPQCALGGPPTLPPIIPSGPATAPLLPTFYLGLNPLAPPVGLPPFAQVSTTQNRVEPVLFDKAGRFLVICAVLPHFNDAMYAWVEVRKGGRGGGHSGHD